MRILLGILLVPLIEIVLFVQIGGQIGVIGTLAWVFLTGALGLVLMRLEPHRNAHDLRAALAADQSPASPMAHSALRMMAAVLLVVPGFFTDALGALALIPALRHAILTRIFSALKASHARSETVIIEGEYERAPEPGPGQAPQQPRLNSEEKRD
ncbi:MAG: FxsA family protein [Rhodobacteraceae bacterium]|nr:MAG: FxsA family protein [Paracoccaceae bacterium]